jgi:excisionase family DNA binding protein
MKTQTGSAKPKTPTPAATLARSEAETFLTRPEAAEYLRVSVPTLERWARRGIGPRYRTFGARKVFYSLADLRAYAGVEAA